MGFIWQNCNSIYAAPWCLPIAKDYNRSWAKCYNLWECSELNSRSIQLNYRPRSWSRSDAYLFLHILKCFMECDKSDTYHWLFFTRSFYAISYKKRLFFEQIAVTLWTLEFYKIVAVRIFIRSKQFPLLDLKFLSIY